MEGYTGTGIWAYTWAVDTYLKKGNMEDQRGGEEGPASPLGGRGSAP